jgi:hypothetical protein
MSEADALRALLATLVESAFREGFEANPFRWANTSSEDTPDEAWHESETRRTLLARLSDGGSAPQEHEGTLAPLMPGKHPRTVHVEPRVRGAAALPSPRGTDEETTNSQTQEAEAARVATVAPSPSSMAGDNSADAGGDPALRTGHGRRSENHRALAALPSDGLRAKVEAFLTKYDAVVNSEAYKGFMAMGWIHGGNYTGENWRDELEAVRSLVSVLPVEGGGEPEQGDEKTHARVDRNG